MNPLMKRLHRALWRLYMQRSYDQWLEELAEMPHIKARFG